MHAGDSFLTFWDHYFPFLNYLYPYIVSIVIYSALLYVLIEVAFFLIIHFGVYPSLKPHVKPPAYDSDPLELFMKIVHVADSLDCYSAVKFFEGFFCGASLSSIKQDNYRSFLAWVMFALPFSSTNEEQREVINRGLEFISNKLNISPEEGHNDEVKHVCMTCSDMQYTHRPLFIYLLTGLMNVISESTLLGMGFQKCRMINVTYWYRPSHSEHNSQEPMLFFHGITTGWVMYLSLVARLGADRAIVLMDMDAIKVNSLVFNMPSREEYSNVVKAVLDKHNISHVSVVGHSFGSITAAWFIKCYPDRVSHLTLLDPVSLLLSLPDVAYNFLYRKPKTMVEWYIYLGASQEITVSYALRRNFWWYKNLLWLEDVPAHIGVLVGLAGGDEVGNATAMKEYAEACHAKRQASVLNAAPISSVYVDGYSHAQMTCCGDTHSKLLEVLHVNEKKAS